MKKMVVMALCVLMAAFLFVNGCAMENMRRGQRGEAVKEVQERLISLGYLEGPADGAFGPKTEAAVLAFQKDRGLDATGIVGEATYGEVTGVGSGEDFAAMTALVPVASSMDYAARLAQSTNGRGGMSARLHSYRECAMELGAAAARRSVDPLDTSRYILEARSALEGGIFDLDG